MKGLLYSKFVITDEQRKIIDDKTGEDKMMHLIADIIISSLKQHFSNKYKSFLEAMEQSQDSDLNKTAEMLGKYH